MDRLTSHHNAKDPTPQRRAPLSTATPRIVGLCALRLRGILNDALAIYSADATLASAFVARWCVGSKAETAGGVFQVREDEPVPRLGATMYRTP